MSTETPDPLQTENCPKCGLRAEHVAINGALHYACDAIRRPDGTRWESDECMHRTLARRVEAAEALNSDLLAALSPPKWVREGDCYKTPWATVWDNGTWHTWDADGVGGENDIAPTRDDALAWATFCAFRQGFILEHAQASIARGEREGSGKA